MGIAIASAREAALEALGQENNPFVAWANLAAGATLGGAADLTGGSKTNAVNGNTSSWWLPDVTGTAATLVVTFDAAITVPFAAIAAHNLADLGASIRVQFSSDAVSGEAPDYPSATWTDGGAGIVTPTDNSPVAFRMVTSGQDHSVWRFRITGLTAGDPLAVGVAFMGEDLVIPRRFYQGFDPVLTPTQVELQSNVTAGGNLVSSSVIRRGSRLSFDVNNIPATFIRSADWLDFQASFNEGKPSFFGWRPDKYPQDLHYIWRDGDVIRPSNTGPRDFMSISASVRAHEAE